MPVTLQPSAVKYKDSQGTFQSIDCLTADPAQLIDDTAGDGDTNKTWSADKIVSEIPSVPVQDVQVNGTSVLSQGVASIPFATYAGGYGIIKARASGVAVSDSSHGLYITKATDNNVKEGTDQYNPIVPYNQHLSTFYGLAKAAGDTTQSSSSNAVGTYTTEAKAAIQDMLGAVGIANIGTGLTATYDATSGQLSTISTDVQDIQINGTSILSNGVANIPVANASTYGTAKVDGTNCAVGIDEQGRLVIATTTDAVYKEGTSYKRAVMINKAHVATFYGLAKAAGDTTMTSSSNAIGTYTETAKTAIQTMLGVDKGVELVETISGTTPTIIGQPNVIYKCSEVLTLSITPPANGTIDVYFTSGSTATTLTVPNTVKFPGWFNVSALDTSTIYEIMITDGVYGSVMAWQN